MRTQILCFVAGLLTLGIVGSAEAQFTPEPAPAASAANTGGSLGVGVTQLMFVGPQGVSAVFDAGPWHLEGLLGVNDPVGGPETNFGLGARFWYHVDSAGAADFSLGGGLGYSHFGSLGDDDNDMLTIDAGAQIRAFVVPNVALSATFGLSVATADQEGFEINGNLLGGLGIHYYFR